MSNTRKPSDQLTDEGIGSIADQYGFASPEATEKWIMDFEAYRLMRKFIPNCTVKGGMAVPFHLSGVPGRLSVDVDAVTTADREDAKRLMDRVFADRESVFTGQTLHKPQNPRKTLPLLTYFCKYDSVVGATEPEVKIDLFYGGARSVPTKRIHPPSSAVGVDINFEVEVYDYYPLIGDKLTTLVFDTLGLHATDPNVPKHVHDVASLVRSGGRSMSIGRVAQAFESSSRTQISYAEKNGHDAANVYDDLAKFRRQLLRPSRELGLEESYSGRFDTFGTLMLGRDQRRAQMHTTDVMMVSVLAEALALVHRKRMGEARAEQIVNDMLSELDSIRTLSPAESGARARQLLSAHKGGADYDRIRTSPAEHVYLYNCLSGMKDL